MQRMSSTIIRQAEAYKKPPVSDRLMKKVIFNPSMTKCFASAKEGLPCSVGEIFSLCNWTLIAWYLFEYQFVNTIARLLFRENLCVPTKLQWVSARPAIFCVN